MPSALTYPTGGEYREALYNTKLCFRDQALVGGDVTMDQLGMPKPISGASASVFTIRNADGRRWAVKCFTRLVDHQEVRYQRISETLQTVKNPWRVDFEYLHDGVMCRGTWYPALKMEWVEGTGLLSFIENHLLDPHALANLASKFAKMVEDLSALGIAHGDLQHGNLLVTSSGQLKLIDYDGMFVPSLAQMGACEKGHINYQSPARTMSTWGPYLDNFSAWIIYVSLVALTIEPTLWTLLHDQGDEALLFRHDDFADYRNSRAFLALTQSPHSDLKALGAAMSGLWTPDVRAIPSLNPANLPMPNEQSALTVAATASASTPMGPIPDWLTQAQPRQHSIPSSDAGNASWVTGHLPAVPPVIFAPSRLALRLVASLGLSVLIAAGLSAGTGALPGLMAGAAALAAILLFITVSVALFCGTPEWRAKHEKLALYKKSRDESANAARAASKFEQARRDVDNREKKAVDKVSKEADKAKASEQKELAGLDSRLGAQIQRLDKQKQKLQANELKETGHAWRAHQQQHVTTYLRGASISSASIPGIGPGVVRSLASCGITTAADFSGVHYQTGPRGGQQVYLTRPNGPPVHPSGVGEKKARDLEYWRRVVEGRAIATQPSSLPAAQGQAIRAKYALQRQVLADQEKAARAQAISDQRQVSQKWAPTHSAASGELVSIGQGFAKERAQADLQLTTAQRQASTTVWQRDLTERELAAYRGVSYRRYVGGVIKA